MIITKRALSRRTILRGVGTTIALPLLDAMVPALTAQARSAAAPVTRLGFIYTPNGYIDKFWTPKTTGKDWEMTRSLQALAPYRDDVTIVSGLGQKPAEQQIGDNPG